MDKFFSFRRSFFEGVGIVLLMKICMVPMLRVERVKICEVSKFSKNVAYSEVCHLKKLSATVGFFSITKSTDSKETT